MAGSRTRSTAACLRGCSALRDAPRRSVRATRRSSAWRRQHTSRSIWRAWQAGQRFMAGQELKRRLVSGQDRHESSRSSPRSGRGRRMTEFMRPATTNLPPRSERPRNGPTNREGKRYERVMFSERLLAVPRAKLPAGCRVDYVQKSSSSSSSNASSTSPAHAAAITSIVKDCSTDSMPSVAVSRT